MIVIYPDGTSRELKQEEIDVIGYNAGEPQPTAEERIAALEKTNEMLTECILELSELLYN